MNNRALYGDCGNRGRVIQIIVILFVLAVLGWLEYQKL
jgi:hypothetical protein